MDETPGNPSPHPAAPVVYSEDADPDSAVPIQAARRPDALSAATPRKPGYRIGPFYFVPEFGTLSRDDPWAHRKGEPRVFALFWSVYLMGAAMLTLFAIGSSSIPTARQYQIGAASMLTMIALGATLLWPLVRLSQASPRRPVVSTAADLFVLLAPMQVVIWPLPLLTNWPLEIVAGLAGLLAGWTLLIGVIIARGIASDHGATRILSMLTCAVLVATGPLLLAIVPQRSAPHSEPGPWMISPLTAIWAIIAAPSGLSPRLSQAERLGIAAPLLAAGLVALGTSIFMPRPAARRSG